MLAAFGQGGLDVVLCVDEKASPEWWDGWTDALAAVPERLSVRFELIEPSSPGGRREA
jgi:hypothetical protein